LGAGGAGFDAGEMAQVVAGLRRGENSDAPGLAGFAALGLVFELLVVKEKLFPGGEDEVGTAVDAGQYSILKLH